MVGNALDLGVEQFLFVGRAGGVVGLSCFVTSGSHLRTLPSWLGSASNNKLLLQGHSLTGEIMFFSAVIDSLIDEL